MDDLTQCTATQLLGLFRSGQASPVEATQAVLQRIARFNPSLNAFCLIDEEAAMASARQSQARWQAHRRSGAHVLHVSLLAIEKVRPRHVCHFTSRHALACRCQEWQSRLPNGEPSPTWAY